MSSNREESGATASNSVKRIYLTGFMGAGKSTVGALLAAQLQWRFFDVDAVIENRWNTSVTSLFSEHGENHFRNLELETLRSLHEEAETVISLGGGAVETAEVRSLLADDSNGTVVFLEAPLHRLIDRCAAQDGGISRPLLRDVTLLESRYEKRLTHYKMAHLTVATQDLTPEEVAASIMKHIAALTKWK
jgi:shikimate kinase